MRIPKIDYPEMKRSVLVLLIGIFGGLFGSVASGRYLIDYSASLQQDDQTIMELSQTKPRALPGSMDEALQNVRRSVAPATAVFTRQGRILGVGAMVTSDGWVATTSDVISADVSGVSVEVGGDTYAVEAVFFDSLTRLTMVRLQSANGLPVVPFGDASYVESGDTAFVLADQQTIIPLSVIDSQQSTLAMVTRSAEVFTTNFALSQQVLTPTGLLVNSSGEWIGLTIPVVEGASGGMGAIPLHQMLTAIKALIRTGELQRASLGVSVSLNADDRPVVVVLTSSAMTAGWQKGDVILRFADVTINRQTTLAEQLSQYQPGENVSLTILRAGIEMQLEVELGK